ncbi:hypothetical protein M9458_054995 [Cirrhinus mrigala]|uniref:Uncharacterized protein n=1 Tax=Cirrhinus mrigala TaxID=683832 RepID=A0ABD0MLS0_CIRMR
MLKRVMKRMLEWPLATSCLKQGLAQKSAPTDAEKITEVLPSDKPTEGVNVVDADAGRDEASTASVQSAGQANELRNSDGSAAVAEQSYSADLEQNQCLIMDSEDCAFKTPQKRRLKQHHMCKQPKRMENCESESESD